MKGIKRTRQPQIVSFIVGLIPLNDDLEPTENEIKQRHSPYMSEYNMVQNFAKELKDYQARIIATDNNPNEPLDNVRWQALSDIES